MGLALIYGFPLILVLTAAGLGVGSVAYFTGGIEVKNMTSAAVCIAGGIPIVAALSFVVRTSEEMRDIYCEAMLRYVPAMYALCAQSPP